MSVSLQPAGPWFDGQLLTGADGSIYQATGVNRAKPYCEPITVIGRKGLRGLKGLSGPDGTNGQNGNPGQNASINCAVSSDTRRILFTTSDLNGVAGPCEIDLDECCEEPPEPVPAITVMKDCSPAGPHLEGDNITYTYNVCATGSEEDLVNVVLTDNIFGQVGTVATLAQGTCQQVTYVHTVTAADVAAGSINNTVTATADGADSGVPVTSSDNHTAPTAITPAPSISLEKDCADTGPYRVGETVNVTFNITNTGNVPLTNVTVSDPSATVSGGPLSLAIGASDSSSITATYVVTQAMVDAGSFTNTATVQGTPPTGPVVTDTDSHTITTEGVECVQRTVCGKLLQPECDQGPTMYTELSQPQAPTFPNGPSHIEFECGNTGVTARIDGLGSQGSSAFAGNNQAILLIGFGDPSGPPLANQTATYSLTGVDELAFDDCPPCVEIDWFLESLAEEVVIDFDNPPDITNTIDVTQNSPTQFTGAFPQSDGFIFWTEEYNSTPGNTFTVTGVASGGYFSGMGFGVKGMRVWLPVKVVEESCDGGITWSFISATDKAGNNYTAAQVDY